MKVFFYNPTSFDPMVLCALGVSVKESASAIGRFGTGLKYAIAQILARGGRITIHSGGMHYHFELLPITIRGRETKMVHMNGKMLPFGEDYGNAWEDWALFRELYSNALDEGGGWSFDPPDVETVVEAELPAFAEVVKDFHKYFTPEPIRHLTKTIQIMPGSGRVYNQGVFVLEAQSAFSYNFTRRLELTEDRTLPTYRFYNNLAAEISILDPSAKEDFIRHLFEENARTQREVLNYVFGPSPSTLALFANGPEPFREFVRNRLHKDGHFIPCKLSPREEKAFDKALFLVQEIEPFARPEDFNFTDDLSGEIFGLYHTVTDRIWIGRTAFRGVADLAATLLEEWLHKKYKIHDGRQMQDHLLKRLIALIEGGV